MNKRTGKSNVATLNRLNEEDENALLLQQEEANRKKKLEADENFAHDIALAQAKLRNTIDDVFKVEANCETPNSIEQENYTRLKTLENILINQLTTDDDNNEFDQSFNLSSSSSNSYIDHQQALRLSGLYLTNECVANFSFTNLLSPTTTTNSVDQNRGEIERNCLRISFINMSKNSLKSVPLNVLGLFENLEVIDLSENQFEAINLVGLSRFRRLKEINLSSNHLKWFTPTEAKVYPSVRSNDGEESCLELNELSSSLFLSVHSLNLANNDLVSSNCLVISQFRNLR